MSYTIWIHPDNYVWLRAQIAEFERERPVAGLLWKMSWCDEVRTSEAIPRFVRRWEFPQTPFTEYEESDEKWAIPLGFGKWVDTNIPFICRIKDSPLDLFLDPFKDFSRYTRMLIATS